MDKQNADRILTEYLQRIYGFALSKCRDSYEAEELASDITYEVYLSLLRDGEIYNINSYIWRISSYVFAHWVEKQQKARERGSISVDEVMERVTNQGAKMPSVLIETEDAERAEREAHEDSLKRLRREIAYLGDTQRKIIVAHYYGGKSVKEISDTMGIPVGTVKWHLYDARKTIKEGMNMERNQGTLGINPIQFCSMGHSGCHGSTGDTSNHLNTVLAQNIAYAAYWEPKTEAEIAEELGITPVFIKDIVDDLEEYGFMTRVEGGKLRTDIIIHRGTKETDEAIHALKTETAARLCELLAPVWTSNLDRFYEEHKQDLYVPDEDINLWRWSGFMMGDMIFWETINSQNPHLQEPATQLRIKRPDGGDYVALAYIDDGYSVSYDGSLYWACGMMNRGSDTYNLFACQMSTGYDSRPDGWGDNKNTDYEALYEYYTGQLPETKANISKYQRLYDRGLIVKRNSGISVNVPVCRCLGLDMYAGADMQAVNAIYHDYAKKILEIKCDLYPPHVQSYIRGCDNGYGDSLYMYFYRWMLDNGILSLPEDDRRGGIMTVVFADTLPKV